MMALQIARAEVRRAWTGSGLASRFALAFLLLLGLSAAIAPWISPALGTDVNPAMAGLGPSASAWLGTDHLGRPIAWRLLRACLSFTVPGLFACAVAGVLGVLLGALSGWFGGAIADVLRWLTGTLAALPRFVFVLLACAAWGDALPQLAVAVGIAYTPSISEAVHSRIESLRSAEYLMAGKAHGVPPWRLLWIHGVLAGCGRLIARHLVLCFAFFVTVETTLAYIGGFGVQEPMPSWGNMLAFEWGWSWTALAPAVALWVTIASLTWLADGLRELSID